MTRTKIFLFASSALLALFLKTTMVKVTNVISHKPSLSLYHLLR